MPKQLCTQPILSQDVIGIMVSNIRVGKKEFSFDYLIWRNGRSITESRYNERHTRAPSTIRKLLQTGWATELLMSGEHYLDK